MTTVANVNAKNEKMTELLVSLLDCGYADLGVLLESKYDFYDIIDEAKEFVDGMPNLNQLLYAMLSMGVRDITDYIEERKGLIHEELSDEDYAEFQSLEFNPQEDIEIFVNYLDTHAWLDDKLEQYQKFFPKALDMFEEMTGIALT